MQRYYKIRKSAKYSIKIMFKNIFFMILVLQINI
jgi:hypothetical protein